MSGNETALNLLAEHPALIGFESPSRMLVSTVKEVFEVRETLHCNSQSGGRQTFNSFTNLVSCFFTCHFLPERSRCLPLLTL